DGKGEEHRHDAFVGLAHEGYGIFERFRLHRAAAGMKCEAGIANGHTRFELAVSAGGVFPVNAFEALALQICDGDCIGRCRAKQQGSTDTHAYSAPNRPKSPAHAMPPLQNVRRVEMYLRRGCKASAYFLVDAHSLTF